MEGLSHLGVQCTTARDRVDDSDERRRGLHRQRLQRAKASEAATTRASEAAKQTARASEAATADDTTSGRPDDNSQSQSQ
ncbi:hypothetical protein Scep_012510 [Stephania cephalantha]|uniref:Uncharacterized protein n=1 Tax=Stephania cephalantha TaxID=152367 RepID=A0AAP0P6J2_9MAGN